MKRILRSHYWLVAIVLIFAGTAFGQYEPYFQPRIIAGASAAQFRISLDAFENVYQSRWGPSFGGFVGVRTFGAHYLTLKTATFEQSGKQGAHPVTGKDLQNARWEEQWYSVGLRVYPPVTQRAHSYYGFGISFFDVNEVEDLSVFTQTNAKSENDEGLGSGFYLEIGLEYFPMKRLAAFFEMQVASGGVRGKTGFEAMSVGGFRFAAGLSVFPF